jgi:hypothetical protein
VRADELLRKLGGRGVRPDAPSSFDAPRDPEAGHLPDQSLSPPRTPVLEDTLPDLSPGSSSS